MGSTSVNFARAGADYTAIELSEASLELTKKRFSIYGLQGTFHLGSAEDLLTIVPAQDFDLVYSFGVLHHTPNPKIAIDSAKQYLGPESEFRLMMYAQNSWKNIMIESGYDRPEAQSGCPVAYTYTHDELRLLLKDYEILDMHQDHIFPYRIDKYLQYEYEYQPWFNAMPKDMFQSLERALGWHILISCKLKHNS